MFKNWITCAFISMLFAGVTAVIAKKGLTGISGDLGVTVRTCFVFAFTLLFAAFVVPLKDWEQLKASNWLWLGASAATTTLSWIFYYNAIKFGEVSTVALIDKGSVVVTVLLSVFVLHEVLSVPRIIGAILIAGGLVVIARS